MKAEARPNVLSTPPGLFAGQLSILLILLLFIYREVIPPLVLEWYEHENFSYGFLIPLICVYLIWDKRSVLSRIVPRWCVWGIASVAAALLVGILGQAMGEPFLSRVSLVLTCAALVHLFGGWMAVRVLAFPLSYLLKLASAFFNSRLAM